MHWSFCLTAAKASTSHQRSGQSGPTRSLPQTFVSIGGGVKTTSGPKASLSSWKLAMTSLPLFWLCHSGKTSGTPVSVSADAAPQAKAAAESNKERATQRRRLRWSLRVQASKNLVPLLTSSPLVLRPLPACGPGRNRRQQPQHLSSRMQSGTKMTDKSNQTSITHSPMKKPNWRKDVRIEARFAKKDTAVVAVVASEALPACL
mmetsp:Transcript_5232/g.10443  ORF Transcript_5232/g.10443 Transcript_5232/m.10443 type:complete len:204 (+) Transcript_5232:1943-2554(+)